MESFATPYPVIFHDGEREHDKGQIGVHSVLTFKRFQSLLSQKVGLPANQLSAVFVCRRTSKDTEKRQKLPINDNTNFNIILNQHNPIWEKDCHFLVSMKKSKKERKGTRRRNMEAEAGDDDESVSPRGSLSPQDERSKPESPTSDGSMQEASLTSTQEPRPSMQGTPDSLHPLHQRVISSAARDGRSGNEKILLRREQTSPGSPKNIRQNRGQSDKQIGSSSLPVERGSSPLQTDSQYADKPWVQSEPSHGKPMFGTDHKLMVGQPSQLQAPASRTIDGLQDRYSDTAPARSILLQRNGVLNLAGAVASAPPFSPVSVSRPMMFPQAAGMLLSRAPSGVPGLVPGTSAAKNLQQAQAHYLNSQAQYSDQMHLTPQALSRMRGVVRDLAAYESGNQKPLSVCRHCCTFRERNINPTPFHLCVHDRVTNGFRGPSPAGPIERPVKRLEAAA